jgi:hypothetical protein
MRQNQNLLSAESRLPAGKCWTRRQFKGSMYSRGEELTPERVKLGTVAAFAGAESTTMRELPSNLVLTGRFRNCGGYAHRRFRGRLAQDSG